MRLMAFLILISFPVSAFAQAPKFVPFTVDEQEATNLRKWIDEQPTKYGLPLLNWIDLLEQKALKAAADKAAAEKAPDPKAVPPADKPSDDQPK